MGVNLEKLCICGHDVSDEAEPCGCPTCLKTQERLGR